MDLITLRYMAESLLSSL